MNLKNLRVRILSKLGDFGKENPVYTLSGADKRESLIYIAFLFWKFEYFFYGCSPDFSAGKFTGFKPIFSAFSSM